MLKKNATVLLNAHSQYRGVYVGLAEQLKTRHKSDVHLYVGTPQEKQYYESKHRELFASISIGSALYEACRQDVANEDATVKAARANEHELGTTFNELIVSDRHLGRGYSLGGFRHPRSRISSGTTYFQMLNGINKVIAFWQKEIREKSPDLILNPGKILSVVGRSKGIPVRILAASRYKNYYYWAVNEFFENPLLEPAFQIAEPTPDIGIKAPYASHLKYRSIFQKQTSILRSAKWTFLCFAYQIYWTIRGYEASNGYYATENAAYIWRQRSAILRMTSPQVDRLTKFNKRPFVFFPLATEPETALQMLSPEYFSQLSAIASIARDLPAGIELAVKEHYAAAGRRPTDFYDQIQEHKNVRFMNMEELGLEAVKQSAAIATISGTSGFEGAALGRPVITFGRHNLYNFLPHVMIVTEETQLKDYLAHIFSNNFDKKSAKSDGRRFLQAIVDTSFDLEGFMPSQPDEVSESALSASYLALIDGIEATDHTHDALASHVEKA